MRHEIRALRPGDDALFDGMLDLFGTAFEEPCTYGANRPSAPYRDRLLASGTFVALVALDGASDPPVVGALAGYLLQKFEAERAEFYIYDLAVAEAHRRQGIATRLIARAGTIAAAAGAHVMFVQADRGDAAAIALYGTLGTREEVLSFDIPAAPLPAPIQ